MNMNQIVTKTYILILLTISTASYTGNTDYNTYPGRDCYFCYSNICYLLNANIINTENYISASNIYLAKEEFFAFERNLTDAEELYKGKLPKNTSPYYWAKYHSLKEQLNLQ